LTVLDKLSSRLGRRDEVPNQELATQIVASKDGTAVKELVDNLSNKDKKVRSDCVKVLYEIGEKSPELIAPYHEDFGKLLGSSDSRLVWGGVTALDSIALVNPEGVYLLLPEIMKAADGGSVIARDHAVGVLTKLATLGAYSESCVRLLLKVLRTCPDNQFPMYAEMSLKAVNKSNRASLTKVFNERMKGLKKESQKKRVKAALSKLGGS
jgi:hypothetical protein